MWLLITGIIVWLALVAAILTFFHGSVKVGECKPRAEHE